MIHEDIQRISLPSWIGRVPSDLGSASHGGLSQDALRTTVTVVLVSSLVRIWGPQLLGSRERQLLENFLDFSVATDLALMRKLKIVQIDGFHELWLKYLRGVQKLFPHHGLTPNQHISLHLRTTLKNYGPAPGQRTNVCERLNYLLQRIPTNSKSGQCLTSLLLDLTNILFLPGEMEMTMLTRLCMSQNIHVLLKNLPPELATIGESFSRAFDSDQRGTLPNEVGGYQNQTFTFPNSVTVTQLGDEIYALLRSYYPGRMPLRGALLQPSIIYRRATYSTFNTSEANSFVILGDCYSSNWRAAQITDIIVQKTEELNPVIQYRTVIAVRLFDRLSDDDLSSDIYTAKGRNFSVGCLFYKRPDTTKILVQVEDVTCHFARNPLPKVPGINKDCIHVRPLYRVSHVYLFFCYTNE
jgi:hypothetical protein